MEISNYNSTENTSILEDNNQEYSYTEPDYNQNESIGDGDYYSDSYNFYPDAGF